MSPDPLAEAEVLQKYGRTRQAITVLRAALSMRADQPELQAKLAVLERSLSLPWKINVQAMFIPWLLFLASATLVIGPLVVGTKFLGKVPQRFHEYGAALFIVAGGLILLSALIVWFLLFLHAWFRYLRTLPPEIRAEIETAVPRYFRITAFEPVYSRVRRRYFSINGT